MNLIIQVINVQFIKPDLVLFEYILIFETVYNGTQYQDSTSMILVSYRRSIGNNFYRFFALRCGSISSIMAQMLPLRASIHLATLTMHSYHIALGKGSSVLNRSIWSLEIFRDYE